MKAVIIITGNWCAGYWWKIISNVTGETIKELGPYHATYSEKAKQLAYADAEDYANSNNIEIVRYA